MTTTAGTSSPTPDDAEEKAVFVKNFLTCTICMEVFREPVTSHCGHTFCRPCFQRVLHYNDQSCPLCRTFLARDLRVNVGLQDIVQEFHNAQERSSEDVLVQEGEVLCDVCTGDRKRRAEKSCLVCLASYCRAHMKLHTLARRLRGHKLVAPISNLEDRACPEHGRPLELYCVERQQSICALCVRQGRNVIPAEEEWNRKKAEVDVMKTKLELTISKKEGKLDDILQSVHICSTHIEDEIGKIKAVFKEVSARVQEMEEKLLIPLQEKQRAMAREAETLTQDLQKEVKELRDNITALDRISKTQDHIHFLQSFPPLPCASEGADCAAADVDTELSLGAMRNELSTMMEQIQQELDALSDIELKRVQKFAVDVTLDPSTAHPYLILSEDGTRVAHGQTRQDLPDNPQRFDVFGSVLGHNQLATGRHYWEVHVGEKTGWDLGVTQESCSRRGNITLKPENGYWALVLHKDKYVALEDTPIYLSLSSNPKRVGVYVDYDEGLVSFYNVEAKSHIYTFSGQMFTEKLHPYFSPHCILNNSNEAPLIISPVSSST